MGFEEVGGNKRFVKVNELTKGENLFGYWLETKKDQGKFKTTEHTFMGENGTKFVVSGGGMLDNKISDGVQQGRIKVGALCRLTYGGKQVIEKGDWKGQEAHTWAVAVDPSKTLDTFQPVGETAPAPQKQETPTITKPSAVF